MGLAACCLDYERKEGWQSVVPCGPQPGRYVDWFEEGKVANEGVELQLAK